MRRNRRFLIYFLIGFIIYFIFEDEEGYIPESMNDWILPLLAVVLVLLLGLRFWRKEQD